MLKNEAATGVTPEDEVAFRRQMELAKRLMREDFDVLRGLAD